MTKSTAALLLTTTILAGCSTMSTTAPPAAVSDLAPTGKVRAAINFGNAVLAQRDPATGEARGVSVDLARELGRRLGVPVELVYFESAGKVNEAAKENKWDIGFFAIDPVRAKEVHFTPPYVLIEGTYLVFKDSPYRTVDDLDREGVRIVVAKGSAYDLHLGRTLKKAKLVVVPTTPAVAPHFVKEKFEAGAGIKQGLGRFAAENPQTRLVDGRFMVIEQAMGTLRGREAGGRYLSEFIEEMKSSGFVARALAASGVEATVAPAAR